MAMAMAMGVLHRISQEMEENKRLPLTLARTGSVGLSHNSISKKIGKLFIERNNVNLHFDVLDTPEFFWEQVWTRHTIPYHTINHHVKHLWCGSIG
jgi:uncharacterized Rmd1/YagE family protein